jgi:hypothetical protein
MLGIATQLLFGGLSRYQATYPVRLAQPVLLSTKLVWCFILIDDDSETLSGQPLGACRQWPFKVYRREGGLPLSRVTTQSKGILEALKV